jgi:hypothetical protein
MRTLLSISPGKREPTILNDVNISMLKNLGITHAILFSAVDADGSSQLAVELNDIGIEASITKMSSLSVEKLEHSDELRSLAWTISNEILAELNSVKEPFMFLGRGSRLHDHLLWLAGTSVCATMVHWDTGDADTFDNNSKEFDSKIAPKILGDLLELMANAKLDGRQNYTYFNSTEIASMDDAAEMAGVQAATKAGVDRGFIDVDRISPPLYSLTTKGLPTALNTWMLQRQNSSEIINHKMLISFGRLPNQTNLQDGNSKLNMLQHVSKIEAHDSNLFILQKHDDKLDANGLMTFSDALGNEILEPIHDELKFCKMLLDSKAENEDFNLVEPLLMINPDNSENGRLQFYTQLFNSIRTFELDNTDHLWTFDITSCLGVLGHLVSTFSMAAESKICYVVKSRAGISATGLSVNDSPFARSDHVLEVPSSIAIKSLQGISDSKLDALMVMLYHERGKEPKELPADEIEALLFDGKNIAETSLGITFDRLVEQADVLNGRGKYQFNIEKNSTRFAKDLISNQLITKLNVTGAAEYVLTDLGEFVANWLVNDKGLEW